MFSNNSNAVPSYVAGHVGGADHGAGTVKSERALLHNVVSPFWTGPLRSPQRLQNTFAHESFMDELAARAKADPVEFRLRHLSDPRMIDVVKAAAKAANWDARPSPKPRAESASGIASGRGISCVAYEGDNGYAAMVAEVEVESATGKLNVKRIVVSIDAGPISNPDGLRNQMRRRRAARHEPRPRRRSHLGRPQRDFDRLANLSLASRSASRFRKSKWSC